MNHQIAVSILTDFDVSGADSIGLRAALVLAELGFPVTFVSTMPEDENRFALLRRLAEAGIDDCHILISKDQALPIDRLFSTQCCLVDISDLSRFRFLADLPVHTWPAIRMVGVVNRLVHANPRLIEEIIERLDAIAGSYDAAVALSGDTSDDSALLALQQSMAMTNLRHALLQNMNGDVFGISKDSIAKIEPGIENRGATGIERTVAAACASMALGLDSSEWPKVAVELQMSADLSPSTWAEIIARTRR